MPGRSVGMLLDPKKITSPPPPPPVLPHYLAIYGDRYNGLPGLFNKFTDDSHDDLWMRYTWLNSIKSQRGVFIANFIYKEWFDDVYYSGTDFRVYIGYHMLSIATNHYHNWTGHSEDFSTGVNNLGSNPGQVAYGSGVPTNPVIDFHVFRTGLHGSLGGTWSSELYVNNTLRFTSNHIIDGDSGHPLARSSMGGIVFGSQYGSYSFGNYIPIDDVMVGTTQGGSDIMAVADFESGYAPLDDSSDYAPNPSFEIKAID